jgi:hypothetical protein
MDIRPHLTASIAVVSAGVLVAALPAIVPPSTPQNVTIAAQVPKDVWADVALRQDASALVDAFFATGLPGVVQTLLTANLDPKSPEAALINAFFDTGVPGVTQQILLAIAGGDPETAALINGFFNGDPNGGDFEYPGIPDVVRQLLVANTTPKSVQESLINGFFLDGGAPEVVRQFLVANTKPGSTQESLINGFFNGDPNGGDFEYPGIPDVVRQFLIGGADPTSQKAQLINAFFLDGGLPAVVQGLLPSNPLTDAFFEGGAPLVVGAVLLGVSDAAFGADSTESGAIKAFFQGYPSVAPDEDPSPVGVPALTHFLIDSVLGTVKPFAKVAPNTTSLAGARTSTQGATADLPDANEPIDGDAKTVTLSTAGNGKKTATAADDTAGKAEDVTDKIKGGNKAEVDPILLENKMGGGGATDAFTTWNHLLQKLVGGGKSPKPATGTSTTPTTPALLTEPVAAQEPAE